jgi:hypothetical protein
VPTPCLSRTILSRKPRASCHALFSKAPSFPRCLNREERLEREGEPLRSDDDPELILHIPFTCDVKVKRGAKPRGRKTPF